MIDTLSRKRTDDQGVAAVVGFVLILAAAITYYSYAAQNEVPKIGAKNEQAWDAEVGADLTRLAHSAGEAAGASSSVREVLPPAPDAPSHTMLFLAPLRSAAASGSIEFASGCASATLTHVSGAASVVDLQDGAQGCLTYRGDTAYATPFRYRVELGGVLRVQSDKAVVLSGPPLDADPASVALTLVDLDGAAQSLGVDRASTAVTLGPKPSSMEISALENADSANWTFTSQYPDAWKSWYDERLDAAGVAHSVGDCPSGSGCSFYVALQGPLSLSVSYGRYDAALG